MGGVKNRSCVGVAVALLHESRLEELHEKPSVARWIGVLCVSVVLACYHLLGSQLAWGLCAGPGA